ncbi:MAG: mercury resistance protein [Candidatus Rokubacteria bacterium]|nr:mercury resistance protein [Candidatus Rokubacteria bacterium]
MTPPPRPRSVKGYLLLGLAFITCPCHLPLLLAVLAGTGLAGALSQYFGLVFLVLSVIFVSSLIYGLKVLKGSEQRRT